MAGRLLSRERLATKAEDHGRAQEVEVRELSDGTTESPLRFLVRIGEWQ